MVRSVLALMLLVGAIAATAAAIAIAATPGDPVAEPEVPPAATATPAPAATATPAPGARATSAPPPPPDDGQALTGTMPPVVDQPVRWRDSRPLGVPWGGRLREGVQLPHQGRDFFTWDPILKRPHNRSWRRYGTDALVRTLLKVLREHRAAHPEAPRVGIGDLSRPRGGEFGRRFGGLGHVSHQNGLDADVYYPRRDRAERRPYEPSQVDRLLAQDLVDRFVEAGAQKVFVGPRLGLRGPRRVVVPLVHHDDHLHVRIAPPPR